MATSGTATFNPDLTEIIEEAFERAGVELRTGYEFRSARRSLNLMASEWANRGLNLWTVTEASLTLSQGTVTYNLEADCIDVIDHVLRTNAGETSQSDIILGRISESSYSAIPNKLAQGRPLQVFVKRIVGTPTMTVYPAPDTAYTIRYWYMRRIEDASTGTNTMDMPHRFIPALVAGLSYYIAMKKPELQMRVPFLKEVYEEQFLLASTEDRDRASVQFVPKIEPV